MANTYKNIVITPNRDTAANVVPTIQFSGGDANTNTDIYLRTYTTSNGTLSFEGSAGQLFSITNDLSNVIFSVNDVSGIPSIEVDANGLITLAEYGGNVAIGRGNASYKLDVNGSVNASAVLVNDLTLTVSNTSLDYTDTHLVIKGGTAHQGNTLLRLYSEYSNTTNFSVFKLTTSSMDGTLSELNTIGMSYNDDPNVPGSLKTQMYLQNYGEILLSSIGGDILLDSDNTFINSANVEFNYTDSGSDIGTISFKPRSGTNTVIDHKGNVLIGRTNSTVGQNVKLDVNGAINASAVLINGNPALPNTSGVSFNGNLNFPTGNVGIGTSTPNTRLMVYGTTGSTADFRITGQNISSFMSSFAFGDTDVVPVMELLKINGVDTARSNVRVGAPLGRINWYGARGNTGDALTYLTGQVEVVTTSEASGGAYPGGAMIFKTAEANNAVGAFERMRLDASGNLLIGRTNSTVGQNVKLDVAGSINAASIFANGNISITSTSTDAYLFIGEGTGINDFGSMRWDRTKNRIVLNGGAGEGILISANNQEGIILNPNPVSAYANTLIRSYDFQFVATTPTFKSLTDFQFRTVAESFDPANLTITSTGNVLIGRAESTVGQGVRLDVNGGINAASVLVNGAPIESGITTGKAIAMAIVFG